MDTTLAEKIDAILPQTQCRKCGFQGCKPYAEALAEGLADINRCPPGGELGIQKLANLLGVDSKPLDPVYGTEGPRLIAAINEAECIGCTKCIPPCPVDAIVGSSKFIHTVIAEICTGCELCIAPCPVNCITMQVYPSSISGQIDAAAARSRFQAKNQRLAKKEIEKAERINRQKQMLSRLSSRVG